MKAFLRVLLVLLGAGIAALIIFFCLGNKQLVTVDLLRWETEPIPVWVVAVTAFCVGFCLPSVVLVSFAIKASYRSMKQRRKIRALEGEVNALRNLPLAEAEKPDAGDELTEVVLTGGRGDQRKDEKTQGADTSLPAPSRLGDLALDPGSGAGAVAGAEAEKRSGSVAGTDAGAGEIRRQAG